MNENLADEIRKTIESIKDMKTQVSGLNNYLSILEGMVRADAQKRIDEAYQRGLEDGKKAFDLLDSERDSKYQRGLDDAWECARKLFSSMADSDIEKAFPVEWNNGGFHALINLQPQEAIAKLKVYEEKQKADDEIKVGDEVKHERGWTAVVTWIFDDRMTLMGKDGTIADYHISDKFTKTGRHFDIMKILKEMQT